MRRDGAVSRQFLGIRTSAAASVRFGRDVRGPQGVFVQVAATRVVQDDHGEAPQAQKMDRLTQQLRKRDDLGRFDAAREQSASPADGAEINAVMSYERRFHRFTEITLANEAAQSTRQKGGQERIHPATGRMGWDEGLVRPNHHGLEFPSVTLL